MSLLDVLLYSALMFGVSVIAAGSVIACCALWWYALSRIRKCAYETYLLADMYLWMDHLGKNKKEGSP